MQVKKQQLEPGMEQWTGSGLGKEFIMAVYCHSVYLTFYAEYIMRNARLDKAQAGIKIARRNIHNPRYADNTTLRAESEEALKNLLMKVKEESEEAGLKLNIQKIKIVASDPRTSRQIEREKMEAMTDVIFLGSKITADGDCSHKIKRCLLLGRKAMTKLDSTLKAETSLCSQSSV